MTPPAPLRKQAASLRVLEVTVEGRRLALDVGLVQAIERPERWVRLPGAPLYVAGVVELRDQIVAVVDLGARLGLSGQPTPPTRPVVLIESDEPVALAVDEILGVTQVEPHHLVRPPGCEGAGLSGVSGDLLLLDAEAVVDARPLTPLSDLVDAGDADGDPGEGDERA